MTEAKQKIRINKKKEKAEISDSELSDDSIEKYYSKKIGNDENNDVIDPKNWGKHVRNFYGSSKSEENKNSKLEYIECEKMRARMMSIMKAEDFLVNNTLKVHQINEEQLLTEFMQEKYEKELKEIQFDRGKQKIVASIKELIQILVDYKNSNYNKDIVSKIGTIKDKIDILKNIKVLGDKKEIKEKEDETKTNDCEDKIPLTYEMKTNKIKKNKKRKSDHPRIKNKGKYTKKMKIHKNSVKIYKGQPGKYEGEKSGIRKNIIHSTKL